jgi:hypothetical protein
MCGVTSARGGEGGRSGSGSILVASRGRTSVNAAECQTHKKNCRFVVILISRAPCPPCATVLLSLADLYACENLLQHKSLATGS